MKKGTLSPILQAMVDLLFRETRTTASSSFSKIGYALAAISILYKCHRRASKKALCSVFCTHCLLFRYCSKFYSYKAQDELWMLLI